MEGNTRRKRNHSGMCATTIERKGILRGGGVIEITETITNLNTTVVIIDSPVTINQTLFDTNIYYPLGRFVIVRGLYLH